MSSRKQLQFVMFFEPELQKFYSFCEERGILVEENPQNNEKIIKFAIENLRLKDHIIKELKIKLPNESFRRRPIPTAFLAPRKYRFPIYSTEEPIYESQLEQISFNPEGTPQKNQHKESIKVRVYLGSIREQIQPAKRQYPNMNTQYIDEVDIKLITSVNEVIRTVCRKILQDYKIVITTKSSSYRLILKVKGRDEYMYGNEQLSSYLSVLHCLSENKRLEVEIVEEDINREREQFNIFIFNRFEDDVNKGDFQPYPWVRIAAYQENFDFLMWYLPDPYYINIKYIRSDEYDEKKVLLATKNRIANKIQEKKRRTKLRFPRFLLKQNIQVFIEKRREEIEKKIVSIEGDTIYSGQCNHAYYFEVVKVRNIQSLLMVAKPETRTTRRGILKLTNTKDIKDDNLRTMTTFKKRYDFGQKARTRFCLFPYQFNVSVELYYNGEPIFVSNERDSEREDTQMILIQENPKINQVIQCLPLSQIMMETSVVFKLKVFSREGDGVYCGVGVIKLFDEYGYLRQGDYDIQLYAHENLSQVKLGCYDHFIMPDDDGKGEKKSGGLTTITVHFPTYRNPVRWTLADPKCQSLLGLIYKSEGGEKIEIEKKMTELTKLLKYDPLKMLKYTREEKNILREGKKYYKHQSDKLINYLYSIDWRNSIQIAEAYQALKDWAPLKPIQALFLLTPRLSDEKVRYFAVKCLDQLKNSQFCLYSNQITQALVSFETHENPLIDLIIERCCQDPFVVSQEFFWQFWNRTKESITSTRFILYLQLLLMTSPIRISFYQQVKLNDKLVVSNMKLTKESEDLTFPQKNQKFKRDLKQIEKLLLTKNSQGFSFPIRPQMKFVRILANQSKMYDSKKLPFALACTSKPQSKNKNEKDDAQYRVMFKCGDDIKQDHLILQILSVFNRLWIENDMNLKMNIYRVLSTGPEIGFIEIVENSQNSHHIHKEYSDDFVETFDDKAISNYLSKCNSVDGREANQQQMKIVKQNFLRSSAAYLVATYVLGIGDRHSGNYMVQSDGRFFHIDFGHILGNFKTKMNIKRQRTPFVFTSEFQYTIGDLKSNEFSRFETFCSRAYNVLRKHANLIINLMMMMVGAEIPQLQKYSHLEYMVEKLNLEMSDLQASDHLIKEIKKTLQSDFRKVDNWIHQKMRH